MGKSTITFPMAKEMWGEERALQLFKSAGVNHKRGREAKPQRQLTQEQYIKLVEYEHAKLFKKHMEEVFPNIYFTHIGNETGLQGKPAMIAAIKKKAQGLKSGYPDYFIYIPLGFLINNEPVYITFALELKKAKTLRGGMNGSQMSDEQAECLNMLQNGLYQLVEVGYGSNDAIEKTTKYIKDLSQIKSFSELEEYFSKIVKVKYYPY